MTAPLTWLTIHWADVLMHLGLDLSGGVTLKCAMGMCPHKRHQYTVWLIGAIILSTTTVALIG